MQITVFQFPQASTHLLPNPYWGQVIISRMRRNRSQKYRNSICKWVYCQHGKIEGNLKPTLTLNFNLETNLISLDFFRFQEKQKRNKQNEISKPKWLFSYQAVVYHSYGLPSFLSVSNTRPDVFSPQQILADQSPWIYSLNFSSRACITVKGGWSIRVNRRYGNFP